MAKEKFKCDKCKKEVEELIQFGQYGNDRKKVLDEKWYCEECFEKMSKK